MELLQAIGLSAPAGLNAYLTLLLAGLAGRYGLVDFTGVWGDRLTNPYVLGVLAALTAWELVVDKIPGADHINDVIGTVVRPLAGALVMLAHPSPLQDQSPALAFGLGLGLAGALHTLKALLRPVVTLSTLGFGTPVISAAEDTAAAGTVLTAIFAPLLIALLLLLMAAALWWVWRRWQRIGRPRLLS